MVLFVSITKQYVASSQRGNGTLTISLGFVIAFYQ